MVFYLLYCILYIVLLYIIYSIFYILHITYHILYITYYIYTILYIYYITLYYDTFYYIITTQKCSAKLPGEGFFQVRPAANFARIFGPSEAWNPSHLWGKPWENLRKDGEIYGETMGKDGEKLEKCREVEKYIAKKKQQSTGKPEKYRQNGTTWEFSCKQFDWDAEKLETWKI